MAAATAPHLSGYQELIFKNDEKIVLQQGQGIALYQENLGDTDYRVKLLIEWNETSTVPTAQGEYLFSAGPINGSASAGYVYGSLFNRSTSTVNYMVKRIGINVVASNTAVYVPVTVRRITAASGGTLISDDDILKKNTNSASSTAEVRTGVTTVTLDGSLDSRIIGVTTPGAVGNINGLYDTQIVFGDELILKPGEGLALFQEYAGDTDFRVSFKIDWSEPSQNTTQRAYVFENDDGNTTGNPTLSGFVNSNTTSTAPNGILTMRKGERATWRAQVENQSANSTTTIYKMQWATATAACTNLLTWSDVGTSTEIAWSYGLSGTSGDTITASTTYTSSYKWVNGQWDEATSNTSSFALSATSATEFASMIKTQNAVASTSYCLRLVDSNNNLLGNYYNFGRLDVASSTTNVYSKDALASLPTGTSSLTYFFDDKGYDNIASNDGNSDPITGSNSIPVFLFAHQHTNSSDYIAITWNGSTTAGCSVATSVALQVYNFNSDSWQGFATNTTCTNSADFDLTANIFSNPSYYYDGQNWIYARVYQASGTETLRSDYISIGVGVLLPSIAGTVYTNEGTTPITADRTVIIKINGSVSYSTPTDANGNYSMDQVTLAVGDTVTVYLDTGTYSERANTITIASSTTSNITGLNLYQNRIIVRNEGVTPIDITNLDQFDSASDTDMLYLASSTAGTITATPTSEFFVWSGKTYNNYTTSTSGTTTFADIDIRGTFNASSTQSINVSGNWFASSTNSGFVAATSTVNFTSTLSTTTIKTGGDSFYNITFNGSGGVFTFLDDATTTNDLTITAGTASSTYNMYVYGGDVTGGAGTLNWSSSTFMVDGPGNFGGTSTWTFYNLTFGDGLAPATTTYATGTASTTISNYLTIAANQTLNAGFKTWNIGGYSTTSVPFIVQGTFNASSSTFRYTTGWNTNITAATYYNLAFASDGISGDYFGSSTVAGTESGDQNNLIGAYFSNTVGTGSVTRIEMNFQDTSPTGNIRLGLYSNSAGYPDTLLGQSSEVAVANGWTVASGLNIAVNNGTTYWIAMIMQSDNTVSTMSLSASGQYHRPYTYAALPNPFDLSGSFGSTAPLMRAYVT